jgi:hypothetical protein
MQRIALVVAVALLPGELSAQWLDFRTPNIPRTADGRPNLTAPPPRTPDGKPDVSGTWTPETNPYRFDLILDVRDEKVFRPAAEAVFLERVRDFRRGDPVTNCLPGGPSDMLAGSYRLLQSPAVVALLYENQTGRYRQIYMDGRALPRDPNPTWLGYSVGRWDGDTLVVESIGFNDRTWLDRVGHPHSEKLRVTERFLRVDFGHIQYQITYDDADTLTAPITRSITLHYSADTDMLEAVCNENNRDTVHLVGNATARVHVSPRVLAQYAGTYVYREGVRAIPTFMGATQTVTLVDDQLFLNALPMFPQSEKKFESSGAVAEFFLDAKGTVTRLVLSQTEGDAIYLPAR